MGTNESVRLNLTKEWQQTKQLLEDQLAQNFRAMHWPEINDSELERLHQNCQQLIEAAKQHAILGLKMIDKQLAMDGLTDRIRRQARAAWDEAARIKTLTARIEALSALAGKLTNLVGLFAGLRPFGGAT